MSKAATIDALMKSALQLFSMRGFEGTSLRDIATEAKVPLSTIHIYFGSKADLYAAVYAHVLREVNEERDTALAASLALRPGTVDLRDIVRALVEPVVRRARSAAPEYRYAARMLGTLSLVPQEVNVNVLRAVNWDRWLPQWIDAVRLSRPNLSRAQAVWGFSFVVGSMYSWQVLANRYGSFLDDDEALEAEQIIEALTDFSVGGFDAMRQGTPR